MRSQAPSETAASPHLPVQGNETAEQEQEKMVGTKAVGGERQVPLLM